MTTRILFPTDFSTMGQAAFEMATSLARDRGAKLLIVHVQERPIAYDGEFYFGVDEPNREDLLKMLTEIVPGDGVGYEHRLIEGDPASAIVEAAEREGVAMIVMPTHGRTGLLRRGSAANICAAKGSNASAASLRGLSSPGNPP